MKDFAILESCQHSNRLFSHLACKQKRHDLNSVFFFAFCFFLTSIKAITSLPKDFTVRWKGLKKKIGNPFLWGNLLTQLYLINKRQQRCKFYTAGCELTTSNFSTFNLVWGSSDSRRLPRPCRLALMLPAAAVVVRSDCCSFTGLGLDCWPEGGEAYCCATRWRASRSCCK